MPSRWSLCVCHCFVMFVSNLCQCVVAALVFVSGTLNQQDSSVKWCLMSESHNNVEAGESFHLGPCFVKTKGHFTRCFSVISPEIMFSGDSRWSQNQMGFLITKEYLIRDHFNAKYLLFFLLMIVGCFWSTSSQWSLGVPSNPHTIQYHPVQVDTTIYLAF